MVGASPYFDEQVGTYGEATVKQPPKKAWSAKKQAPLVLPLPPIRVVKNSSPSPVVAGRPLHRLTPLNHDFSSFRPVAVGNTTQSKQQPHKVLIPSSSMAGNMNKVAAATSASQTGLNGSFARLNQS